MDRSVQAALETNTDRSFDALTFTMVSWSGAGTLRFFPHEPPQRTCVNDDGCLPRHWSTFNGVMKRLMQLLSAIKHPAHDFITMCHVLLGNTVPVRYLFDGMRAHMTLLTAP